MIVYADYPDNWPQLMPQIERNITTGEEKRVLGALKALRMVAKRYEFSDEDSRGPLIALVNGTWPALLPMLQHLLAQPTQSADVATMVKLLLKMFWSCIYLEIPVKLLEPDMFNGWMSIIISLIARPVDGQPAAKDDRERYPWWKVKKWALSITGASPGVVCGGLSLTGRTASDARPHLPSQIGCSTAIATPSSARTGRRTGHLPSGSRPRDPCPAWRP